MSNDDYANHTRCLPGGLNDCNLFESVNQNTGIKRRYYIYTDLNAVYTSVYQYQSNINSNDKIYMELRSSDKVVQNVFDWEVSSGGVELKSLPIGKLTYNGFTISGR